MDCEQCGQRQATVIWSDAGTFPGADLCRTCARHVNRSTYRLVASRRRSGPKPVHFERGSAPFEARRAAEMQKRYPSTSRAKTGLSVAHMSPIYPAGSVSGHRPLPEPTDWLELYLD